MSINSPTAGVCAKCDKIRYRSEHAAKHAAHRAHPTERMNAYRCGFYWHIGNRPRGFRFRRNRMKVAR